MHSNWIRQNLYPENSKRTNKNTINSPNKRPHMEHWFTCTLWSSKFENNLDHNYEKQMPTVIYLTFVCVLRINCISLRPKKSGPRRSCTKGQVKRRIVWTGCCFSAAICACYRHAPSRCVELALQRRHIIACAALESVIVLTYCFRDNSLQKGQALGQDQTPSSNSSTPSFSQLLPPCTSERHEIITSRHDF